MRFDQRRYCPQTTIPRAYLLTLVAEVNLGIVLSDEPASALEISKFAFSVHSCACGGEDSLRPDLLTAGFLPDVAGFFLENFNIMRRVVQPFAECNISAAGFLNHEGYLLLTKPNLAFSCDFMIQLPVYGDDRQLAFCAFCGGNPTTRDHCPSRILLDEPYPEQLPVVPACSDCNAGFSADEQYLACLISCVLAGSTEPSEMARSKISRILSETPLLRSRIEQSRVESQDAVHFNPEYNRVENVIIKLAKGHAVYELHEPHPEPPDSISIIPLALMAEADREAFETAHEGGILTWPEIGSRAMQRMVGIGMPPGYPWIVVQEGLYRFRTSVDQGISVRLVINEYLAATVYWE